MTNPDKAKRPLTPATFHILLSLAHEVAHGYHIKRTVEERTGGAVRLGAGTLYAGIRRMTEEDMRDFLRKEGYQVPTPVVRDGVEWEVNE